MDTNGMSRFHPRIPTPPNRRFLGAYPQEPPPSQSTADVEFNEDDIFTTDISVSESNNNDLLHPNNKGNNNITESFGILAALPELAPQSHHYHKTSSTSSRSIPGIRKPPQVPPQDHHRLHYGNKYQYQSAPVNVPVLGNAIRNNHKQFDDFDDDEDFDADFGMMMPPHEIVALTGSPILANSVLEGVGRTLKGRDLRQVRNAVWRQIGFVD